MSEFTFTPAKSGTPNFFDVAVPGVDPLGWVWKPAGLREWCWRGLWQTDAAESFHATREAAAEAMLAARRDAGA